MTPRNAVSLPSTSLALCFCLVLLSFFACTSPPLETKVTTTARITAHTQGERSPSDTIFLTFSKEMVSTAAVGQKLEPSPFRFQPHIEGRAEWVTTNTIRFFPQQALPWGTRYDAQFAISDHPSEPFSFQFFTPQRAMVLQLNPLSIVQEGQESGYRLEGVFLTKDSLEGVSFDSGISARLNQQEWGIQWQSNTTPLRQSFFLTLIPFSDKPQELILEWDFSSQGIDCSGARQLAIHSIQSFGVMDAQLIPLSLGHRLLLSFNQPLKKDQDLRGLLRGNQQELNTVIDGNLLTAEVVKLPSGPWQVELLGGVESQTGAILRESFSRTFQIEPPKPELRWVAQGHILPTSGRTEGNVVLPVEARQLTAIDVQIREIPSFNVLQFLQDGDWNRSYGSYQVGEVILEKKIDLTPNGSSDGSWELFHLSLDDWVPPRSGSLFQITLAFRPEYSLYPCDSPVTLEDQDSNDDGIFSYYQRIPYVSRERENPCHMTYYDSHHHLQKMFLFSNLGLTAKKSPLGQLDVFVTDLKTAKPLQGVKVTGYSRIKRPMAEGTSDFQGHVRWDNADEVQFLTAQGNSDLTYLDLKPSAELPLARFDVGGSPSKPGLDAMVFTERGVWNPSDTVHLMVMIDDHLAPLPEEHPVEARIFNPEGKEVFHKRQPKGKNGLLRFEWLTPDDAPTGVYRGEIQIGNQRFHRNLLIEHVQPNRITTTLSVSPDSLDSRNPVTLTWEAQWLHGAPAAELPFSVVASFLPEDPEFSQWSTFLFSDPTARTVMEEDTWFEGKTNPGGKISLTRTLPSQPEGPARIKANLEITVTEPSGRFSREQQTIQWNNYQTFVGIAPPGNLKEPQTLTTGEAHPLSLITIDPQGNPRPGQTLDVRLYRLEHYWWWEGERQTISRYQLGNHYQEILQQRLVSDANGQATLEVMLKNEEWGTYFLWAQHVTHSEKGTPGGHSAGTLLRFDWPGWSGARTEQKETNLNLTLESDQPYYEPGDTIQVRFPQDLEGEVLLLVESPQKLLRSDWVTLTPQTRTFAFPATEAMIPTAYVYCQALRPAGKASTHPVRRFGVLPLRVLTEERSLSPVVTTPPSWRPDEVQTIQVKEARGRSMTYVLCAVDEGLLKLTQFRTPSPESHFFAKKALMNRTWDLFDWVYQGELATSGRVLAVGGDQAMADNPEGVNELSRFKPMVYVSGPHVLERNTENHHNVTPINYVGKVRIMVMAIGPAPASNQAPAFGHDSLEIPVKSPLMIVGATPRFLSTTDETTISATVFAGDEAVEAKVHAEAPQGGLTLKTHLEEVALSAQSQKTITFSAKAPSLPGVTTIHLQANSGNGLSAQHDLAIPILDNTPETQQWMTFKLLPNEERSFTLLQKGDPLRNERFLELSPYPSINWEARQKHLMAYPHGCLEQTISKAFPQLYLSQLFPMTQKEQQELHEQILEVITSLQSFQQPDGTFHYWPGFGHFHAWADLWAGHFLIQAMKMGDLTKEHPLLASWLNTTTLSARRFHQTTPSETLTQSYRLFLLSLAGNGQIGAMNRLKSLRQSQMDRPLGTEVADWLLASAYALEGFKEMHQVLPLTTVKALGNQEETFGSPLRDSGLQLIAAYHLKQANARAGHTPWVTWIDTLQEHLAGELSSSSEWDTHATSVSLVALGTLLEGQQKQDLFLEWQLGEEGREALPFQAYRQDAPLGTLTLPQGSFQQLRLKNTGTQAIYGTLWQMTRGAPLVQEELEAPRGIQLKQQFQTTEGLALDWKNLQSSKRFRMIVSVKNPFGKRSLNHLALSIFWPAGWEFINPRVQKDPQTDKTLQHLQHLDIQLQVARAYLNLAPGQEMTLTFDFMSTIPGHYYAPPLTLEAMYDPKIFGQWGGSWVTVQ